MKLMKQALTKQQAALAKMMEEMMMMEESTSMRGESPTVLDSPFIGVKIEEEIIDLISPSPKVKVEDVLADLGLQDKDEITVDDTRISSNSNKENVVNIPVQLHKGTTKKKKKSNLTKKFKKQQIQHSLMSRLETKADEDPPFVLCDFIALAVVEYLGVRSLVRFGATSKSHREVVFNEIMRRKEVIALIEEDVSALIGSRDEVMKSKLVRFNIPRVDVNEARALVHTAMRLIDDEIGILENHPEMERYCCKSWEEDYVWKDTDVFFLERRKFLPVIRSEDVIGPMYVFPDCFYFPTQGEISVVSQDDYRKAGGLGRWLLDAIIDGFEANQDGDTSWVYKLVEVSAFRLANEGIIDAFRVAARSISHAVPSEAPNPFWNVLELADEFSSNGVGQKEEVIA
jgi:hypothetical protein